MNIKKVTEIEKNCLSKEDLERFPVSLVLRVGVSGFYSDKEGNYFQVIKISPNYYWVTNGW